MEAPSHRQATGLVSFVGCRRTGYFDGQNRHLGSMDAGRNVYMTPSSLWPVIWLQRTQIRRLCFIGRYRGLLPSPGTLAGSDINRQD